jgi:ribosomal protein L37AE/L43A
MNEDSRYLCPECGGYVDHRRVKLGYKHCLDCGEVRARDVKHCIVPMPKSNYIVVTDMALLIGLNTSHKGGVR